MIIQIVSRRDKNCMKCQILSIHVFREKCIMSNHVKSCFPGKIIKKKSYVSSAEITKIVRVVSLATCLLVFIFIPTKYYQSMFKDVKVMECTWMSLRTDGGCYVDRYIPRTYWSGVEKGSSCPSIRSG